MRRLFVPAVACTALLLFAAPAFAGLARPAGGGKAPALHVARRTMQSPGSFTSLAARLSGSVTVTGKVYDASHAAVGDVPMKWWSWSESGQEWRGGSMTSRADGSYSASPQVTAEGEIWAYPDSDTTFARRGQPWVAGATYSDVDISPGRVSVSATRDGQWNTFSHLTLSLSGDQAYSADSQPTSDATTSPATVEAEALGGNYTGGSVNFWPDEGVEFAWAFSVIPGPSPSSAISVSEASAQSIQFSGYAYSGKPGVTVTMSRAGFPAGWRNYVTGSSDPGGEPYKDYGVRTSQGGAREPLSLQVPSTAKPGYSYWIGLQHIDAAGIAQPLYLETAYQVCTIQPSKTTVTRKTRLRVTGIVPTEGHWGSQLGNRKSVVLWWHKGTARVPSTWDPREKGWLAVGDFKTSGTGSYRSPYFKVARTGTFVVQYDSDAWYDGAYTSTAKVTVR
jgi:hypothetical protein